VTQRPDLIDAIEGFYVTLILDQLHRTGVLRALGEGRGVGAIARKRGFDQAVLTGLLDYVSLRSNIIRSTARGKNRRFALAGKADGFSMHLLDQYVGAFGPCLLSLPQILKNPAAGQDLVDRVRHAAAFADGGPAPELVGFLEALRLDFVLDIGCGGGQLLTTLAQRRPALCGIGIDANPSMIAVARKRALHLRLGRQLKFRYGDAENLTRAITRRERERIQGICAVSVANALFGSDGRIDGFFSALKALFPGRILLLGDYYSRLGPALRQSANFKRTLFHDTAQLLSSQGLPPRDLKAWRRIYSRNAVKLLHAYKATNEGVCWFIHMIEL
jgi:SAM-dependent methyltransferase